MTAAEHHLPTLEALTCDLCGSTWWRDAADDPPPACATCLMSGTVEILTCRECGGKWARHLVRGRKPHTCGPCRAGSPSPRRYRRRREPAPRRTALDVYPVEEWVQRRCEGESLVSIGEEYGLSRERVRQLTERLAPHKPWDAYAMERRGLKADASRYGPPCKVCGDLIDRATEEGRNRTSYCSAEHFQIMMSVRWLTSPERYEAHRLHAARTTLSNPTADLSDEYRETLKAIVAGSPPPPARRFVVRGSAVWDAIEQALDGGWPLLDALDEDAVAYVRAHRNDPDPDRVGPDPYEDEEDA